MAPALIPHGLARAAAESPSETTLRLGPQTLRLRTEGPATPVWQLGDTTFTPITRTSAPTRIAVTNETPQPALICLHGLETTASAEPLIARPPLAPGAAMTLELPHQPGTFLIDPRFLPGKEDRPALPRVLVIDGGETYQADREDVLLIEDWKIGPDGAARLAGRADGGIASLYTVNRKSTHDIMVRPNERVRVRIANGCQRLVIALKFSNCQLSVVAIDGQPAEPFLARDSQIVLAPGTRIDALLDATRDVGTHDPILLHNGVQPIPVGRVITSFAAPERATLLPPPRASEARGALIDLKNAQRIDLALDPAQWTTAATFDTASDPVFRSAAGRTVVLAITNRTPSAATFHLHGHHFRLLDRLDDGWKPYMLDTLAFNSGQTQRIAFNAAHPGRRLMQFMTTAWSSPRHLRWYEVG
jgi:FtsP/CotA-like multicopper oxidase with cupredoxin domain